MKFKKTPKKAGAKSVPAPPAKAPSKTLAQNGIRPGTKHSAALPSPTTPPSILKPAATDQPAPASAASASAIPSSPAIESGAKAPAPVPLPQRESGADRRAGTKRRRPRKAVQLPPLLLEDDRPSEPAVSGPGERFSLGPIAPEKPAEVQLPSELPEAYGTERVFLTARDPHWLYASWDLTPAQRDRYNSLSREGHLILRIYLQEAHGTPTTETHVHSDSKSWFIHVPQAAARYAAELGFYEQNGSWHRIATSGATLTPPESPSQESAAEFTTIPPEVSLKKLFEVVEQAVMESVPLVEAVQQLGEEAAIRVSPQSSEVTPSTPKSISPARQNTGTRAPQRRPEPAPAWTPAQARALAEVIRLDSSRRVWMGSLEITEIVRRHLEQEISSPGERGEAVRSGPTAEQGAELGISSPLGEKQVLGVREKGFWLNVNAELIIYGATTPDADVSIGNRKIRLRPDGTFSYRFALPDGRYPLVISATAADRSDRRQVELEFGRRTVLHGLVGAQAQDPNLKAPRVDQLPTH